MKKFIVRPESEVLKYAINFLTSQKWTETFEIIIKPHKITRSEKQNNLYWDWMTYLGEQFQPEVHKDLMHEFFASKFLGVRNAKIFGELFSGRLSTKRLGVKKFNDYLMEIRVFVHERGGSLPHEGNIDV